MIEIKDEILNGEARYRIRDKDGNIIFDNLTIEQITPVTQEGTPIGKKLFERIEDNNNLVKIYNLPIVSKMYDTYNYLSLDNETKEYYKNMRILIDFTENTTEYFSGSIIPILESPSTSVNGFYYTHDATGSAASEHYQYTNLIYDKDDNTKGSINRQGTSIYLPHGIKNFNIKTIILNDEPDSSSATWSGYYILKLYGRLKNDGTTVLLKTENFTETKEFNFLIDDNNIYDKISLSLSNSKYPTTTKNIFWIYTFDITEGYQERFKSGLQSYININNLGNKLIKDTIEEGKKYELVYDGTMFSAREVV